jgi:hypothetical protein
MIVSGNNKNNPSLFKKIFKFWSSLPKLKVYTLPVKFDFKKSALIIIVTIFIWTFLLGVIVVRKSHKSGWEELALILNLKGRDAKLNTKESAKAVALAPLHWLRSNFSSDEIPKIHIDVKFKHMQKLYKKREEALKVKLLVQGPNDYVPGQIRYLDKTINIKLRLKGDFPDHFDGDKWSFRVHAKGDDHLLGMRRFSLQNPRTRYFEGEILYFEALKREGVLVPRYIFVDVYINGKSVGLMALEEHFSKEMLESQGRKESVIIKFDESVLWTPQTDRLFNNFALAKITPFRSNKVSRSKMLSADLNMARGLLRAFVNHRLPPSKVFDPVLMGRFLAVADVWRAWHQIRGWHNYRFYYNPITALLEPIGFDGGIIKTKYFNEPSPFTIPLVSAIIHGDPKIRSIYKKTVEKLALEMEEGVTEQWARPISKKQMSILHTEFYTLQNLDFDLIEERTRETKRRINGIFEMYPEMLQVFVVNTAIGPSLELVNPLPHGLEVHDIKCMGTSGSKNVLVKINAPFPILMDPTSIGDLPKIYRFSYEFPAGEKDCLLGVKVKIRGEEKLQWVESQPYSIVLNEHPVPEVTLEKTLSTHKFLTFEPGSKVMSVKPGEWEVNNWIVIPDSGKLEIPQGTTLRFRHGTGLFARGAILAHGTPEAPVVLSSLETSNENELWQGVVVLKSSEPSIWSHVQIINTSGINENGWTLPGGVNFYESDVEMDHVLFSGNRSEDALNIVRSKFKLKNVTIKNTTSDAFDSDFSRGTVEESLFENIGSQGGGDGIDVSGSKVRVTRTHFENISDKALSVGESSQLEASGITIENVSIGAASKDGSRLFLTDSKITGTKKADLMAYIKKSEYGPAEIVANALEFSSTEKRVIAQKGNKIVIDGLETPFEELNVKELYALGVNP